MDLALYFRVLWRFRLIVAIGIVLALALAFFSFAKVSFASGSAKVSYRQAPTYEAQTTFVLDAHGFPWGRSVGGAVDPFRLSSYSAFYARLANSDDVKKIVRRQGPLHGLMDAEPAVDQLTTVRAPLPFISIIGISSKPKYAIDIARRGAEAFREYLVQLQDQAKIPVSQRVDVQVVNVARTAKLTQGRKLTLPIVVFLTVLIATIGLAFILENLRPRVRLLPAVTDEQLPRQVRAGERRGA